MALTAYHARSPVGNGPRQGDQARCLAEDRTQIAERAGELRGAVRVQEADKALYEKLLAEVLVAGDPDPEQRLPNAVAPAQSPASERQQKRSESAASSLRNDAEIAPPSPCAKGTSSQYSLSTGVRRGLEWCANGFWRRLQRRPSRQYSTGTLADDPIKKKPVVIKIGTLAPISVGDGCLRVWAKAVKEKSKGELVLDFYWNGTAGDERTMVGNIQSGCSQAPQSPRIELPTSTRTFSCCRCRDSPKAGTNSTRRARQSCPSSRRTSRSRTYRVVDGRFR